MFQNIFLKLFKPVLFNYFVGNEDMHPLILSSLELIDNNFLSADEKEIYFTFTKTKENYWLDSSIAIVMRNCEETLYDLKKMRLL